MTARVMANRIWQMHFGRGLVKTPSHFGSNGEAPSHPELLDYLAKEFIRSGWSIKHVHRLILNSEAFQRSTSHPDPACLEEKDPENCRLAVFSPRRKTAEELRDSMLFVTGELNPEVGGPSNWPEIHQEVAFEPRLRMGYLAQPYEPDPKPEHRHRRSLYAVKLRGLMDPFMQVFNRPDGDLSCERRDETMVTPQVFTQLHGQFFNDRAVALARRVSGLSRDAGSQVDHAFEAVYGRKPSASEQKEALSFLEESRVFLGGEVVDKEEVPSEITLSSVKEQTGELIETRFKLKKLAKFQPDLKPWDLSLEERALAQLCLMLFNSSEFLYLY